MADVKKKIKEELGYDSDLVIDEADEQRLDKMNELDRENEIDLRKKRREILLERYQLIKKKQSLDKKELPLIGLIVIRLLLKQ